MPFAISSWVSVLVSVVVRVAKQSAPPVAATQADAHGVALYVRCRSTRLVSRAAKLESSGVAYHGLPGTLPVVDVVRRALTHSVCSCDRATESAGSGGR